MSQAADSLALRVQAEQIADAYLSQPAHPGKPSTLREPETVQLLLASIRDGNYRETACRQAGISKVTFYNWLKRAEQGDEAAQAFVNALEKAEADAEAETVRNVRHASKLPQFWAAGMTWLERKSPDRWGKRQDDQNVPRVVVQIGVKDSDVQVRLSTFASPAQALSADIHSLSEAHVSDNSDYGYPALVEGQVTTSEPVNPAAARDLDGAPSAGAGPPLARGTARRSKASGAGRKKKGQEPT